MRKSNVCSIIYVLGALFALAPGAFAFGRKEVPPDPVPVSGEYALLITAFDVSALPLSRQLMGETVMRGLADSLSGITFRVREDGEADFYRDFAWENARAEAARALQKSREQRDLLLFRGDARWRYRRDLKAINATIAEQEQRLADVDAAAPVVEERPLFAVNQKNRDGTFPPPPDTGGEVPFAREHKVDAFLVGSLSEFHGRVLLETSIYTLHTRSFSSPYSVLFSSADFISAIDEITGELLAAVSGLLPAGIIVRATPSDAVVIIDGAFAGRGDMDMHTNFPKDVEVEVSAPGYAPFVFPLELNPGELAEVFIDLTPLSLSVFNVEVAANPDSLVYQGGLFVGQTPHTFEIPKGQFAYITVETEEGKMGTVVYRNDQIVRGNARLTKIEPVRFLNGKDNGYADGIADDGIDSGAANGQAENVRPVPTNTLFVNTAFPRPPESTPVERARKGFYRAYGALWIILPATLITSGIAMTYIDANTRATISPPEGMTAATRREIYDRALLASDVRDVAFGVMGVTIGITVFQIIRYLYVSSKDATPLIPAVKPPVEEL